MKLLGDFLRRDAAQALAVESPERDQEALGLADELHELVLTNTGLFDNRSADKETADATREFVIVVVSSGCFGDQRPVRVNLTLQLIGLIVQLIVVALRRPDSPDGDDPKRNVHGDPKLAAAQLPIPVIRMITRTVTMKAI